jgi:hypothetical protein
MCEDGTFSCTGGAQACSDGTGDNLEVCDGTDNDCNPATADGADEAWLGASCDGPDEDLCEEGTFACTAGAQACSDASGDNAEVCDGTDNDCNPATSDGADEAWLGASCDGPDEDLCEEGTFSCTAGSQTCSDASGDNAEVCDGTDNDCNPATADGADETWLGEACDGPDPDLCAEGAYSCTAGIQTCSDTTGMSPELCDGIDNDCDPATADGADEAWLGASCDGPDADLCEEGTFSCTAGVQTCSDASDDNTEVCDGTDNDCNPATADGADEAWLGASCDGPDEDLCEEGTFSCTAGAQACSDGTGDNPEVCDGADNDCNPATADGADEAWLDEACDGTDSDLCEEGVYTCTGGEQSCSDTTGDDLEVCDGEDNDCDGFVDNNICFASDDCHGIGICDPDTGACTDPPLPDGTVCDDGDPCTATDTCQSGVCYGTDPICDAAFEVEKVCAAPDDTGLNAVSITVTNTGAADLRDCYATDELYRDDPTCPPDVLPGDPIVVVPEQFDLPVGFTQNVLSAVNVFRDACNSVSVTCMIGDTGTTITAQDDSLCMAPDCRVRVDKQVSCDGGLTWQDPGLVTANEDGTSQPCVAWTATTDSDGTDLPAEEVLVRYMAHNSSPLATVFDCVLQDSNPGLGSATSTFDIPPQTTTVFFSGPPAACSEELADGEPDTATLSCYCSPDRDPDFMVAATDGADFDCQPRGLEVVKHCLPPDLDRGVVTIEIQVANTADADLQNCVATAQIFLDDDTCPADVGLGTPVTLFPEAFDLLSGSAPLTLTGETPCPASSGACSTASVTCDVVGDGTPRTITVEADDLCLPCGEGCLTRTASFWGRHPGTTEAFLPVNSCAIEINNTFAYTNGSATEDLCFNGRDFKAADTSGHQLRLIRQCTAAELNLAATEAGGGSCETAFPGSNQVIAWCCDELCSSNASRADIRASGCIEILEAFNNLPDTLAPFESLMQPGPALPMECRESMGNGFVNPNRDLGPRR